MNQTVAVTRYGETVTEEEMELAQQVRRAMLLGSHALDWAGDVLSDDLCEREDWPISFDSIAANFEEAGTIIRAALNGSRHEVDEFCASGYLINTPGEMEYVEEWYGAAIDRRDVITTAAPVEAVVNAVEANAVDMRQIIARINSETQLGAA